jgi:hypothetical protein
MAKGRAAKLIRALGTLDDLNRRVDDLVANQAALAYALANTTLADFSAPCADDPLSSRVCRQADCGLEYAQWLERLDEPRTVARKEWEHAAICRALEATGMLAEGKRGLGFAVGKEPLVAAFAARGVDLVATDLAVEDPRAAKWASTNQHSLSLDGLRHPTVCSDQALTEHVSVRATDMNAIGRDLVGFDFVWSACAFEHLGSIEAGLAFVERAMDCLVPGGIAVHTTEFNLDSDADTVLEGDTVLFRHCDLATLTERLARKGHQMSPLVRGERSGVYDYLIDVSPHHFGTLVMRMGGYRITSAVIVVRANATST